MKQLGIEEYGIEFNDLSEKRLFSLSEKAWKNRKRVKNQLSIVVDKEKKKAKDTALIFYEKYYHKMHEGEVVKNENTRNTQRTRFRS